MDKDTILPQDQSSNAAKLIPLELMSQQAGVSAPEEDWTGVTDVKLRRKLQNRLNQRSRRQRKAYVKTHNEAAEPARQSVAMHISSNESDTLRLACSAQVMGRNQSSSSTAKVQSTARQRQVSDRQKHDPPDNNPDSAEINDIPEATLTYLEAVASQKYMGSPTADFLLTLIQFNVFRALLRNTYTLGLTLDWLKDVAVSSFCHGRFNGSAPSSLQPTLLQREKEHHPWLDLFPFPKMRDNLLRAYDEYDEDQLCADMVGWCRSPGERVGVIVWGEPWDPSGWELTEGFLKTWGWTVTGCYELFHATNYWRAQRGEEPLLLRDSVLELPNV